MTRRANLDKIFKNIEPEQRDLIEPLLDEVAFLETRMTELKKLPFVRVHPNDPSLQKTTPAAKVYKECSQSYMNAIRILLGVLRKTDGDGAAELMSRLEAFA